MSGRNSVIGQALVSPNSSTTAVEHEFRTNATITGVNIHTYKGQEFDCLTRVYVQTTEGQHVHVVDVDESVNSNYPHAIGGEDTDYEFRTEYEVEEGDKLIVEFINTASSGSGFDYHGDCTVHYDYDFGDIRAGFRALKKMVM